MIKPLALAALPALLLAGAATAQKAPVAPANIGKDASVPFVHHGGIRTFEPDRDGNGLYIQDQHRNWYHATFYGPCTDLPFAAAIGYRTWAGTDQLSRGDTILVRHDRCTIQSLVHSGPPPAKPRKARH